MKTQKQVEAIEDTLIDTIAKLTEDGHQEIHVLETMLGLPGAPITTGPRHWPGCSVISPMSASGVCRCRHGRRSNRLSRAPGTRHEMGLQDLTV